MPRRSPRESGGNYIPLAEGPSSELRSSELRGVDEEDEDRVVRVEHGTNITLGPEDEKYATNSVITSSYTWWNFIPKNTFEQFHEVSNIYFFIIGVLQLIEVISATEGVPEMWSTLFCIMSISALRAAVEDRGKHRADNTRNGLLYDVYTEHGFIPTCAGKIKAGHIVRIKKNQMLPADVILLATCHEGVCFIDRANLNGETQLEVMTPLPETRKYFPKDSQPELSNMRFVMKYEKPNKRFDEFRGTLEINEQGAVDVKGKYLLMRETNLRNTDFIYGFVVYTGNDTKIQQSNMGEGVVSVKRSKVFKLVDSLMLKLVLVQVVLCGVCAAFSGVYFEQDKHTWYLRRPTGNSAYVGLLNFFTWVQLLSNMVPISLVMTAETVKYIQGKFIECDKDLYYAPINRRAKVNRSTIHEDLGLVDYIFSDKTGTLTQNKMTFRVFKVMESEEYGSRETEIARSVQRRRKELQRLRTMGGNADSAGPSTVAWTTLEEPLKDNGPSDHRCDPCCDPKGWCPWLSCCWNGPKKPRAEESDEDLVNKSEFSEREREGVLQGLWGVPLSHETTEECALRKRKLYNFMVHMALSTTVKPFVKDNMLEYQSESAEELAMVNFARSCGFTLVERGPTVLEIQERDENLQVVGKKLMTFNHLATFGFTSKRARVTVIYQSLDADEDASVWVMTKGQDMVVMPLLTQSSKDLDLEEDLSALCGDGLRTLVCAEACLPLSWWEDKRAQEYKEMTELEPGDASKQKQHTYFEQVEKEAQLDFLGYMGLEDQLQLLVPETIKDCIRAGVKVWMITGDKLETARNIGLATNLIDPDMQAVFSSDTSLSVAMDAYQNSRLIEVTGSWSSLVDNNEELGSLFDMFDFDGDGMMSIKELGLALEMLKFNRAQSVIQNNTKAANLNKQGFIKLMKELKPTMYEAVRYDVDEGLRTYRSIDDHQTFPVSLLVNRDAFLVMFPELAVDKRKLSNSRSFCGASSDEIEKLKEDFFKLAARSKSVIFARAQPSMKKKMVTEIKRRNQDSITLAIGDGANDVDMIMAAHIGIGIAGVEGTAAVNNADYALGTFRMLHTLLFVHGFWSYRRIAFMVNFLVYKAVLSVIPCLLFGISSQFSAQRLYDSVNNFCYNLFNTSMPVMAIAILDTALPREVLQNNVAAFREQKNKLFDMKQGILWTTRVLSHGLIIYYVPYFSLSSQPYNYEGKTFDSGFFSLVCYLCLVSVVTVMPIFDTSNFTFLHSVCFFFCSMFSVVLFNGLAAIIPSPIYYIVGPVFGSLKVWTIVLLCIGTSVTLELLVRGAKIMLRPRLSDILRERDLCWTQEQKQSELLKITEKEELKWRNRNKKKKRRLEEIERKALQSFRKSFPSIDDEKEDGENDAQQMKSIVRVMLRFRNLTGAQFESAANHSHQQHDTAITKPGNIQESSEAKSAS